MRNLKTILIASIVMLNVKVFSQKQRKKLQPNIIFIMMDDLGFGQWGVHNDTLTTNSFDPYFVSLEKGKYSLEKSIEFSKRAIPTMNKLAQKGVVFSNAYAASNLCAPSRIAIATGMLPSKLGVYTNGGSNVKGIEKNTHLVYSLKEKGYKTAHIGKWHIGRVDKTLKKFKGSVSKESNPLNNGFDYYYGYNHHSSPFYNSKLVWRNFKHAGTQKGYNTDVFTDEALGFMDTQIKQKNNFYVQLHYHAVHDDLKPKAPEKYYNRFDSDSFDLNNFYAHVYGVDENIKRILTFLKSKNTLENTIIVFTSDNGAMAGAGPSVLPANAPFKGHKGNYFLGGVRVPFFVYWGDRIKKPFRSNELVSTVDILPTLIDAVEGKIPEGIDGKSLLPLLMQKKENPPHEYLFWAGIHSRAWGFLKYKFKEGISLSQEKKSAPGAWLIVKDHFLLRFVGEIEPNLYINYPNGEVAKFQLYDIAKDAGEKNNLLTKMPEKVKELKELYKKESVHMKTPLVWNYKRWLEIKNSK